ncbi:unnamed protein product [Dicrocoelium dendriticum]|nr:unnamed protein product [Dicrocoelium dendriticum]
MERCCGLSFRISLTAFFQVNTLAAELLYQEVARFVTGAYDLRHGRDGDLVTPVDREAKTEANDDSKCQSVLLDVCCGTGTIGLCLSKHFDRVIGIELAQSAVEDARQNARQNNIENVQFYCGRADKILQDVISTLPTDCNIVAVVDPPRSGLHNVVIQCLRRCARLQRIVFVSCDLDAAAKDFIDFARPTSNRFVGAPFVPVVAKAVDLFPQTRHVEVILLLQRVSE